MSNIGIDAGGSIVNGGSFDGRESMIKVDDEWVTLENLFICDVCWAGLFNWIIRFVSVFKRVTEAGAGIDFSGCTTNSGGGPQSAAAQEHIDRLVAVAEAALKAETSRGYTRNYTQAEDLEGALRPFRKAEVAR